MEAKEQNLFQQFFRNELTWLGMIIIAIWAFVQTVVIPINNLQIQLAQIQQQLKTQTISYTTVSNQLQTIFTNQQVDEVKISQLEDNIHTAK